MDHIVPAYEFSTVTAIKLSLYFAAILAAISLYFYSTWRKLAHIQGPPLAHFSGLWIARQAWYGKLFPTLVEVGEHYGMYGPLLFALVT